MGKLGIFSITLKSPNAIYFSGQNVSGHVTVDLNEPMKLRGTHFTNIYYLFFTVTINNVNHFFFF